MHVESFARRALPALLLGAALSLACGGSPSGEESTSDTGTGALSRDHTAEASNGSEGSPALARPGSTEKGEGEGRGTDKVVVCHVPPGNPANAHTIEVGAPAVPAHLDHGDRLGSCEGDGGTDQPGDGTDQPGDGTDQPGDVPACVPVDGACGEGVGQCCDGLTCDVQGRCLLIIG